MSDYCNCNEFEKAMISGIIDLKVTDLTLSRSKAGISGHGLMTVLLLVWSPFSTVRGVQRNYYSLQNKVNKYSTTKGRGKVMTWMMYY
jgi:hypothetical protein